MTALETFQAEYPFPRDEGKAEKDAWYQELAMYQLGWNARTRETNARLTLARDLIAVLSHNGMMPENMMVDGGAAWRKWKAEEMK